MKWWMIVLFILFILIVLCSMILVPHNPAHSLVLQYIYTLASWPLIILILGLVVLIKYKDPISEWIKNLLIKTPKGYEIGTSPQGEAKPLDEKEIRKVKKKLERETKSKKAYMEFVRFERIIRQMYSSQYRLLIDLKAKDSLPAVMALFYYNSYISQGGSKNYKESSYLGWLENVQGLIKTEIKENKYILKLTDRGVSFILYCGFMNYSENIFIPF